MSTTNVNGIGKNWWLWAVILVLLLAGAWWAFGPYGKAKNPSSNKDKASTEETTDNTGSPSGLAAKNYELDKLKEQLADRQAKLDQANETIALLIENCGGKKTVTYTKPAAPKNTGGSGTSGSNKNVQKTPEASYNVNQNSVPKSRVSLDINEQKFCIRLGTQFWPHLAVINGKEFPELVDNKIGGFDLFILPAGSIGSTGKTYGISEDGTAWIEVNELAEWSQYTPDFLDFRGIWVKAERVNTNGKDYWVIKY